MRKQKESQMVKISVGGTWIWITHDGDANQVFSLAEKIEYLIKKNRVHFSSATTQEVTAVTFLQLMDEIEHLRKQLVISKKKAEKLKKEVNKLNDTYKPVVKPVVISADQQDKKKRMKQVSIFDVQKKVLEKARTEGKLRETKIDD